MKRINVITFFNNGNLGSELQAYAMNCFLHGLGYENVVFIKRGYLKKAQKIIELVRKKMYIWTAKKDIKKLLIIKKKYSSSHSSISPKTRELISKFSKENLISEYCTNHDMKSNLDDIFICGSDQIWSPLIAPIIEENFLVKIPPERKIAYAPSFGINYLPYSFKKKVSKYINTFMYIAMRECHAAEIVSNIRGIATKVVIDPIFLLQTQKWIDLSKKSSLNLEDDKYFFCYFLDEPTEKTISYIKEISVDSRIIYICYKNYLKKLSNAEYVDANPEDFLALIRHSKGVVTDSFHATAFSILFKKDINVFSRNQPTELHQDGRIKSFFSIINVNDRVDDYIVTKKSLDYRIINEKLTKHIKHSIEFLEKALREVSKEGEECF